MSESSGFDYSHLLVEVRDRAACITLNRPKALNALSGELVTELVDAVARLDRDPAIGAIIITGSARAFAAGADITEMVDQSFTGMYLDGPFPGWEPVEQARTPLIAAVSGFALGGGCELAMMCDVIVAAESAKFGQPEINIGVIPGFGGTQRLTRAIGKYRAADLILTGRTISGAEALQMGLVSRLVADDALLEEVWQLARDISEKSLPIVYLAKQALQVAFETPLAEGLRFEQQSFAAAFATTDQTEGMRAFVERRDPEFTHE